MATTDELIYKVGMIFDKAGFNGLEQSINKSVKMLAVASAAATAASAAIFAMGKGYAETTDKLIKTSGRINATTSDIQKLTFAAEDNGATMDDVTGSLSSLAKAQEELLRGKGDLEAWGQLNVNPNAYENTSDLLLAVSDRLKDLSSTEAIDLMSRVGISPALLQTLQKGGDGLRSLGAEAEALGLISTPAMLESSQAFMSGWQRATTIFQGVMNKVSASLLDSTINPALEKFNKFASKHMKKISEILVSIFDKLAKAAEFIFALLNRLSRPFIQLVNLMGGAENAAMAFAAAMAIVKRSVIIAMLPAVLVVGALFLAFDDLMSFMSGKESFIGDFFGKFGIEAKDVAKAIETISVAIDKAIEAMQKLWGWTKKATELGTKAVESSPAISNMMPGYDSTAFGIAAAMFPALNIMRASAPEGTATQPITQHNAVSIQVDGSKDPKAVAEEARRVFQEEMNKSAMRNNN